MYKITLVTDFPYKVGDKLFIAEIDDDYKVYKYSGTITAIYFMPNMRNLKINDLGTDRDVTLKIEIDSTHFYTYSRNWLRLDRGQKNTYWDLTEDGLTKQLAKFFSDSLTLDIKLPTIEET